MSEFNGKKFYGFSLHNDPALSTTTRNFEFRYTRPENLDRVIQKVHQPEAVKTKKAPLAKCSRLKKLGRDGGPAFHSRDVDVETHMSRTELSKTRVLSECEIDQLIGKAKSFAEFVENGQWPTGSTSDMGASGENGYDRVGNGDCGYRKNVAQSLAEVHKIQTVENIGGAETDQKIWSNATVEEFREPHPKWVEIIETPYSALSTADIIQPTNVCNDAETQPPLNMPVMYAMTPNINDCMPYGNMITEQTYYVEDSDLEYEMIRRADYTKYCEPRPKIDELANISNDSGDYPHFIELEPQIPCMDLSFLKNSSPLRFTDMTDETQEDANEPSQMKVVVKNVKQSETAATKKPEKKNESKDIKKKTTKSAKSYNTDKSNTSPRSKYSKFSESTRSSTVRSTPTSRKTTTTTATVRSNANHNKRYTSHHSNISNFDNNTCLYNSHVDVPRRKMKNIVLTKSLEDLKAGKIAIFAKMTSTQERTIETLDKLRLSLLDMYVPDNSYETTRRQKNAFEFSVRFSRNFLYPLKGMIEDLKSTSVEQLNSASSNDATARVCAIYTLILQSLQTYQKQLRFFLLDQVPQKLTTLIEIIFATTNICLEKAIFDKHDAIIECLQDRCSKFLGFLEDMHEERFLTARENYRKMNFEKGHANYDLKMFMNDLNMYEPKLVPKALSHRARRSNKTQRKTQQSKKSNVNALVNPSDMQISQFGDDDQIATHVQGMEFAGSSGNFKTTSTVPTSSQECMSQFTNKDDEKEQNQPINRAIMEALQTVTKEQVRQVLEPIIKTLGTALDKRGVLELYSNDSMSSVRQASSC